MQEAGIAKMDMNPSCDLLVVGSGAGGLSAAVTGRLNGLDVIVLEKESLLGGTSALSGGWLWIPGNSLTPGEDGSNNIESAREYLKNETGARFDPERIEAFLKNGPAMVDFFQSRTAVRFAPSPAFPDYHSNQPGAGKGRSIVAEPFDGRELGTNISRLRRPLREMTFMGLNIGSGSELSHFLKATTSLPSALYVGKRLAQYAYHLARYRRAMRLTNGNALMARLLKTAFNLGVDIRTDAAVVALDMVDGHITGAQATTSAGKIHITARRGVVLACGGFSRDPVLCGKLFPHVKAGAAHHTLAAPGSTGDGIRLAESVGGILEEDVSNVAAWMPVSLTTYADGTGGICSHVIDRTKPGMIAVTGDGRRFISEANSYHDFLQALIAATAGKSEVAGFIVCDHTAIRRYGLGLARPFPVPIGRMVRDGYIYRGNTIEELARAAGINPAGLTGTVASFNEDAARGEDRQFGKGSTAYNRFQGDPDHRPNACLAPLAKGPFYAVKVVPSDIGTFAGIRTDAHARVKDGAGRPIPGLYAVGSDNSSIMGGNYCGAGTNLGPAMTFGYVAARHAESRPISYEGEPM